MRVASAVSTQLDASAVASELRSAIGAALAGAAPDLCLLFASAHYEDVLEQIVDELETTLKPRAFIGASAEAVIAGELEYESQPAITLWAAHLPGAELQTFHISQSDLERFETLDDLREHAAVRNEVRPYFILLADPFTINVLGFLQAFGDAFPGRPLIGGLASAAARPNENIIIFDGEVLHEGLVGVGLWGNVVIDTVVSQGCRPIGRHLVITRADRNIIHELGGKPPLAVVHDLLQNAPRRDSELVKQTGLLIGRVINEYQEKFSRGDFLIRNPLGFDANTGALAISDLVRTGQTVQFHVRDGESADEDLRVLLSEQPGSDIAGALLFSCNGRGTHLFAHRHHDARTLHDLCGSLPVSGFFAAGEIGPVGDRSFLHGHTASIGFFRPATPEQ